MTVSTSGASRSAAAPGQARRRRWTQMEGLRAVAATLVFLTHAWSTMGGPTDRLVALFGVTPLKIVSGVFFHLGSTGVSLFYAISGFLLYSSFVQARNRGQSLDLGSYFLRRAARIIPAYWAAIIIIGLIEGNTRMFTPRGIVDYFFFFELFSTLDLAHVIHPLVNDPYLLLHHEAFNVISGNPVGVAWTLCVEVSFYLVLPLWAWLVPRLTARSARPVRLELLLLGGVAVASLIWKAVILQRVVNIDFEPWVGILPNSLDIFAVGMALAVLAGRPAGSRVPRPIASIARRPVASLVAAIFIYISLCLIASRWDQNPSISLFPIDINGLLHWEVGIFSAANVLIAALLLVPAVLSDQGTTFVARFLRNRIVAWIGLVSFGLYLWHVFVLKELASMFNGSLVPLGATIPLAVVAYGLTLGIAAVSWYLMERHVLAWAHRRSLLRADR